MQKGETMTFANISNMQGVHPVYEGEDENKAPVHLRNSDMLNRSTTKSAVKIKLSDQVKQKTENEFGETTGKDNTPNFSTPNNLADRTADKVVQYAEEIKRIQNDFQNKGIKYEDKQFPAINTSIFKSADKLEEQLKALKNWSWLRPEEIFKKDVAFEVVNSADLSEIRPGPLSNPNFCNSLSVASLIKLFENIIVDFENIRMGYASFQFFKNGEWVYVIVDTALPYQKESKKFLFTHSNGLFSLMVGLLEKAYAKLNSCYEYFDLLDRQNMMTEFGCIYSEKIKIEQDYKDQLGIKRLFAQLSQLFSRKERLAIFCVKKKSGNRQNSKIFEVGNGLGIKENSYHLIQSIEDFSAKELRFVRVKNLWGSEFNWSGPFANNSDDWEKHKDVRDALFGHKLTQSDVSTSFYMKLENFAKEFTHIYTIRYIGSDLQIFSLHGAWYQNTLAGIPSELETKYPESLRRNEAFTKVDSDDCWFNNPQYRIKVTQPTRLIVDLSQIDCTNTGRENEHKQIGFYLFRATNSRTRIWEMPDADQLLSVTYNKTRKMSQKVSEASNLIVRHENTIPVRGFSRDTLPNPDIESSEHKASVRGRQEARQPFCKSAIQQFFLEPPPNQLFACYNLLVFSGSDKTPKKSTEPLPYNLKLFANKKIEIEMLSANQERTIEDAWDVESAGGPYYNSGKGRVENPMWCLNPQYLLTFDCPTQLKIILQKAPRSQKKLKEAKLGLSLCFLKNGFEFEPVVTAPVVSSKKFTSAKEELLSKLIAKTKEQLAVVSVKNPYRKIKILKGENYIESTFASPDTACLYLKVLPIESPLLVVPCLDRALLQGDFKLTIFSSAEVGVHTLNRACNPVTIGDWTQYNSGGSHIYSEQMYSNPEKRTWHTNIGYVATLQSPVTSGRPITVKLFLNFAEHNWQTKIIKKIHQLDEGKMRAKKSLVNVDCMVCLYIMKLGPKLSTDIIVYQSPFSPTSSLQYEFEFTSDKFDNQNSFLVVPTTFNVR
jgi:hypothetical protein